jgi:hypothetical protein
VSESRHGSKARSQVCGDAEDDEREDEHSDVPHRADVREQAGHRGGRAGAFRESVKGLRGTEYKVARRKRQESEADLYASQIRKASSTMTRDMRACFLALRGLTSDNSKRGKGMTHWEGG